MKNLVEEILAKAESHKDEYQDYDFDQLVEHARDLLCELENEEGPVFRSLLLKLAALFPVWLDDVDQENENDPDALREQIKEAQAERDHALGQVESLRAFANQLEAERDRLRGLIADEPIEVQPPVPGGWIFTKDALYPATK